MSADHKHSLKAEFSLAGGGEGSKQMRDFKRTELPAKDGFKKQGFAARAGRQPGPMSPHVNPSGPGFPPASALALASLLRPPRVLGL